MSSVPVEAHCHPTACWAPVLAEDSFDAPFARGMPLDDLARVVRAGIRDDDLIGRPRLRDHAFDCCTNEVTGVEAVDDD